MEYKTYDLWGIAEELSKKEDCFCIEWLNKNGTKEKIFVCKSEKIPSMSELRNFDEIISIEKDGRLKSFPIDNDY